MIEKILSTVNLTGTKEIKHILQTKAFRENHLTRIKQCFWLYWQTGFQIYNTYGTPQAHQSHLHSHQQCHISTRMECICQFCNGTVKGEKERRKVSIILFFFPKSPINYEKLSDCVIVPLIMYFDFITPIFLMIFFGDAVHCDFRW